MSGYYENNRLLPLKQHDRVESFLTFDLEAAEGSWNIFLMAGFFDGQEYYFCSTIQTLCEQLLDKKYSGYIQYAHYGGGYDHKFILDYIMMNRPDLDYNITEINGLIMALDVYTKDIKYHWKFWDSYQVIKGGLDALTTTFNVAHKKLTGTVDYETLTDTPETREYLRNDVIGLYEVIEEFYKLELLQGVGHRMTTASLAMAIFRQRYLKDTILYKLTEDREMFVREGYYGGRNEIFKMVGRNVREYDVNSMYPTAMLEPMPVGSKGAWSKSYNFNNPNIVGFIQAIVKTPASLIIPCLPYRYEGKLMFPKGKFTGIFYSAELKYAIELGYEVEVISALIFPCRRFLAKYSRDFYKMRQDNPGDNPKNMTAKLFMNALYGKFAMERERDMLTTQVDPAEGCKNGWTLVLPEYNLWRRPTYTDSPAILPHISAAITAHSRIILHKYLNMFPHKVVYCDTDSIFIEDYKLPHGPGLGELKLENHYDRFIAIQPKFYFAEPLPADQNDKCLECGKYVTASCGKCKLSSKQKLRAKGFNFETKDKQGNDLPLPWTFDDFYSALTTDDYSKFAMEGRKRMSKLRESLMHYDLLMLVERKKAVKTKYSKRLVQPDFSTLPVDINELERQQEFDAMSREEAQLAREAAKAAADYRLSFKRAVMALGGIKPSADYDFLPRWCKRHRGAAIDEAATELAGSGFMFEDANALYDRLWRV